MIKSFTTGITVFSAHAEVVPATMPLGKEFSGILRARGGSSGQYMAGGMFQGYSPRTRR